MKESFKETIAEHRGTLIRLFRGDGSLKDQRNPFIQCQVHTTPHTYLHEGYLCQTKIEPGGAGDEG
ncbi:MAG: hypothetical protein HXS46_19730 [Theionarchaea archaeon]|nr:hypothetical protein [Theionarchaea archaeon]